MDRGPPPSVELSAPRDSPSSGAGLIRHPAMRGWVSGPRLIQRGSAQRRAEQLQERESLLEERGSGNRGARKHNLRENTDGMRSV